MIELIEIRLKVLPEIAEELQRRHQFYMNGLGRYVDFADWAGKKFSDTIPMREVQSA